MKKSTYKALQKYVIFIRIIVTALIAVIINVIADLVLNGSNSGFAGQNGIFIGIMFLLLNGMLILFDQILLHRKQMITDSPDRRNFETFSLLAGGIAHDFNNILTTVSGYLSISILDLAPGTELRDDLESALKATQRASGLTAQLLRFAKGGEPIKKSSSLEEIITDSTRFILAGSGVAVNFRFPEQCPEIQIDPDQISQVIQNIVLNAKQAMDNHGKIDVSVDINENFTIKQAPSSHNKYLRISIADSGPGISPKILNKIMQPYFTTKSTGNGLGLASSVNIIKNHNGILDFTSKVGKGTVFQIYLPVEN